MGTRAVLLDIDGVLYVGERAIHGATDAVAELRRRGYLLRFVTNTTSRSRSEIRQRLQRLGFVTSDNELVTPTRLAVAHCRRRGFAAVALLAPARLRAEFATLPLVAGPADARAHGGVGPQLGAAHSPPAQVDCVVVGDLGEEFDYATLNGAFRWLLDGAELVALQRNRTWRRGDGLALDVGPFVAALEYATGRPATVVGKPAQEFFDLVLHDIGVDREECLMVGDDVEADIAGAQRQGIPAAFVRTGKHSDEDLERFGVRPQVVLDSIADLPDALAAAAR
ncbi:HAD-IIA family hydrolase [Thermoleophilum album]|uniref:HAD-IIA family hydrolase n=1 Tax=Thermoleophilum album TaxID=29539 RepID=UPI00237C5EA0|nr:HAD-IIA family hydrolase [Thermoleophilum album]WDT93166.1 HAD-IIA family hydrolase [Thermoleophilum album]